MTAPNVQHTEAVLVPINRYPHGRGGKVTILEVLKVFYEVSAFDTYPVAGVAGFVTAGISTSDPGTAGLSFNNPKTFDFMTRDWKAVAPALSASTFAIMEQDPIIHDLTDGAGHGMLIATDQIYLTISTANMTAAASVNCRIMYRYKSVSLTEYIGIVQSQQ